MKTQQLIYQDARNRFKTALAELPAVLERHTLLCSRDNPIPGLPCFDADRARSKWDATRRKQLFLTPWGEAALVYGHDLSARRLYPIMPLYRLCDGADGVPVQAPELGHAVVDTLTGIVTVYQNAAPEQPVYNTRVLLDGKTGKEVLQHVWADLALAGVPVCPMELYGDSTLPYPWEDDETGGFAITHAANDQVSVPLVGYVLDPETNEVVYLHIAGHKTALRSIWGALSNGGSQTVSISGGGHHHFACSSHNYSTFSETVDPDTNLYRLIVADRRATDQEAEGRAYLVIPRSETDLDLGTVLAARLNALLPIPVLPEWGKTLRRRGIADDKLLTPCLYGGDVEKAFLITEDGWIELVEELIQNGELSTT